MDYKRCATPLIYVFWVWWPFVTWIWYDLKPDPSLVSNINSISSFPYGLGVFGEIFGPKQVFLRSPRPVTWKPPILTFDLTLPWLVTSFWKFRGRYETVSSRAFERRVARLAAISRSRVRQGEASDAPPPPSKWKMTGYSSQCRITPLHHVSGVGWLQHAISGCHTFITSWGRDQITYCHWPWMMCWKISKIWIG